MNKDKLRHFTEGAWNVAEKALSLIEEERSADFPVRVRGKSRVSQPALLSKLAASFETIEAILECQIVELSAKSHKADKVDKVDKVGQTFLSAEMGTESADRNVCATLVGATFNAFAPVLEHLRELTQYCRSIQVAISVLDDLGYQRRDIARALGIHSSGLTRAMQGKPPASVKQAFAEKLGIMSDASDGSDALDKGGAL